MVNPLIEYLEQNDNSIFSCKTLAKRLKVKKPKINYYKQLEINSAKSEKRSVRFICPAPITVGSLKNELNLLKYNSE